MGQIHTHPTQIFLPPTSAFRFLPLRLRRRFRRSDRIFKILCPGSFNLLSEESKENSEGKKTYRKFCYIPYEPKPLSDLPVNRISSRVGVTPSGRLVRASKPRDPPPFDKLVSAAFRPQRPTTLHCPYN